MYFWPLTPRLQVLFAAAVTNLLSHWSVDKNMYTSALLETAKRMHNVNLKDVKAQGWAGN